MKHCVSNSVNLAKAKSCLVDFQILLSNDYMVALGYNQ